MSTKLTALIGEYLIDEGGRLLKRDAEGRVRPVTGVESDTVRSYFFAGLRMVAEDRARRHNHDPGDEDRSER